MNLTKHNKNQITNKTLIHLVHQHFLPKSQSDFLSAMVVGCLIMKTSGHHQLLYILVFTLLIKRPLEITYCEFNRKLNNVETEISYIFNILIVFEHWGVQC